MVANLPPELVARPQWVCWRFVWRVERWTKVPISPHTGAEARANDPATWGTFAQALARFQSGGMDGLGYEFAADDPYCGVDFDHCRDRETGTLDEWVRERLAALATYAEVSPSATGVKAIVRAVLPGAGKGHRDAALGLEVYDRGRYFALTGQTLASVTAIPNRQEAIDALLARYFPPKPAHREQSGPVVVVDLADVEVIARARGAKNGANFAALWAGDRSGYGSPSEADAALIGLLAFWTGPDPARLDRLFRASGLFRPKWDDRRGEATYGERTIALCLDRTEYYRPARRVQFKEVPFVR